MGKDVLVQLWSCASVNIVACSNTLTTVCVCVCACCDTYVSDMYGLDCDVFTLHYCLSYD